MLIINFLDHARNRDTRQISFQQQQPGIAVGRVVSTTRQWQYGRYIGETPQYVDVGNDTESENEVATISAAITAREISDLQNQVNAAQTIYPDSSLPSYNQGY